MITEKTKQRKECLHRKRLKKRRKTGISCMSVKEDLFFFIQSSRNRLEIFQDPIESVMNEGKKFLKKGQIN